MVLAGKVAVLYRLTSNRWLPTPACSRLTEHTGYPLARQGRIHFNSHTLTCKVIEHRQRPNGLPTGQTITDKIHRPLFIGLLQGPGQEWHRSAEAFPPSAPNGQARFTVQPIDPLVIAMPARPTKQDPQPSIAIPGPVPRQLHQVIAQRLIPVSGIPLVAITGPIHAQ